MNTAPITAFALFALATVLVACGGTSDAIEMAPEDSVPMDDMASDDSTVDAAVEEVVEDVIIDESDDVEIGELI